MPLLYAHVNIFTLSSLEKFVSYLYTSDQKWDSIRRIPYSTPGRWVQSLDISEITFLKPEALYIDSLLTKLFPLLPLLNRLTLHIHLTMSNRALETLLFKDGVERLQSLKGLKVSPLQVGTYVPDMYDPLIELLRCCPSIEELELASPDDEATHQYYAYTLEPDMPAPSAPPLCLSRLRSLALVTIPLSPLFSSLLNASLPSLHHLMVTPYDDSVSSPTSKLLAQHGSHLTTLHVNTPKHWPTVPQPSQSRILLDSPTLKHLSLEYPLPMLVMLPGSTHPLQILTIPRPNIRFFRDLEYLLPRLPQLRAVQLKNVKWLGRAVSGRALEAGVQGEMREWRRRLGRRGVRLLDGDWRDPE